MPFVVHRYLLTVIIFAFGNINRPQIPNSSCSEKRFLNPIAVFFSQYRIQVVIVFSCLYLSEMLLKSLKLLQFLKIVIMRLLIRTQGTRKTLTIKVVLSRIVLIKAFTFAGAFVWYQSSHSWIPKYPEEFL
jgi:hypothetical protein